MMCVATGMRIKLDLTSVTWGLTEVHFLTKTKTKKQEKDRDSDPKSLITLKKFIKKIILKPLSLG